MTIVHNNETLKLEPRISLFSGVSLIIGAIVGSGIFVSPTGVLIYSGSVGSSLVIWLLCGIFSLIGDDFSTNFLAWNIKIEFSAKIHIFKGALCYAELGTSILKSGGDYAYIREAFGDLPAFIFLWISLVIVNPASNAICGLTFAKYVLQPFYGQCDPPEISVRLLSLLVICTSVFWAIFLVLCSKKWFL